MREMIAAPKMTNSSVDDAPLGGNASVYCLSGLMWSAAPASSIASL